MFVSLQLVMFEFTLPRFSHWEGEFDSGLGGQMCGVLHLYYLLLQCLLILKKKPYICVKFEIKIKYRSLGLLCM